MIAIVVSILLVSAPFIVQASQITPNPPGSTFDIINDPFAVNNINPYVNAGTLNIDSTSTLTNSMGAVLNNSGTLNNAGKIENHRGMLNNAGTVNNFGTWHEFATPTPSTNSVGATVNNYGIMDIDQSNYNNRGTLNNFGTFVVYHASPTNSVGATLNNYGTINFDQSAIINNDGTLNNFGSWMRAGLGTVNNSVGATLNNYGSMGTSSDYLSINLANAGTLNNFSGATLSSNRSYVQTAGQTINNGTMSLSGGVDIQGGSLRGTGTINAPVVSISTGATVSPGSATTFGTLTVNGDLQSSGNMLFHIGGLGAGQFDVLAIHGMAFLNGGTVGFDFVNFTPVAGNSWDFLYAGAITGWETLRFNLGGLNSNLGYTFSYANGVETLRVYSVPEPDSFLLLVCALGGLAIWRRLKRA